MLARTVVLTAAVAALAGCGSISSTLGLERHVPDETQVTVRPNLTLPPDYDLMPPGTPSAVSAEHEGGANMGTPQAPPKEERGFFGSLFHGDFFGNEPDAATAKEHAAEAASAPAPDVNGTPQAPAPSQAVTAPPAADAAPPAPEAKKDEPGFFGRIFGGIF
jgi:hypothetical protein